MELNVNAYHIGFRLNLKDVDNLFNEKANRKDSSFRLYVQNEAYFYFKEYGGVVFVNATVHDEQKIMQDLFNGKEPTFLIERYTINIDKSNSTDIDFSTIYIPEINLDFIHLICLNLAQSVALDHYQSLTDSLLEGTNDLSKHLESTGRIKLSRKRLSQFIGRTMNLKNRIAENLYIFEAPPIAWSDEQLSFLDEKMNQELDFRNRHSSIQHSLNVVKENLELFIDMLNHQHSSMLEWIIIILILVEVVHLFI